VIRYSPAFSAKKMLCHIHQLSVSFWTDSFAQPEWMIGSNLDRIYRHCPSLSIEQKYCFCCISIFWFIFTVSEPEVRWVTDQGKLLSVRDKSVFHRYYLIWFCRIRNKWLLIQHHHPGFPYASEVRDPPYRNCNRWTFFNLRNLPQIKCWSAFCIVTERPFAV